MKHNSRLSVCLAALTAILGFACVSAPAPVPEPTVVPESREPPVQEPVTTGSGFSPNTLRLVQSAVFEVVIEKASTDPTAYEKELNWETVPYAIRTDKYYSIGTAFAISNTELITAFHVINLGFASRVYDKYYIRDARKNVYEVDRVVNASNERDFLIFTVKDRTFTDYFEFDTHFEVGNSVYSIGNALGEGIVVRNGLVLGTVPEEESGRWDLLKSSADSNPGNSGGPLVTPEGKVVGLVTSLRDNILYSVPAEVIRNYPRDRLSYRIKLNYSHLILANRASRIFETSLPLPADYKAAQSEITAGYQKDYETAMGGLFGEAPEYLTGPNNAYLLNAALSSTFPELDFVDTNDDNWKLSDLEVKGYNLPDNGRLMHAQVSSFNFYKITKPKSVSLEKISTDPKYIMDTILQNIRMDRTLWGNDKYRILSFGEPEDTGEYRDAQGRTWLTANWIIGFDDKALIMYILPLPNGPAVITTIQNTSLLPVYEWDLRKTCDHTYAAYSAAFEDWGEFIALGKFVPAFLQDFKFNWQPGNRELSFEMGEVSFSAGAEVFDWADTSDLFLAPSYYKLNGEIRYGIRKFILNRDVRGREFIILYKNIRPDPKLGAREAESWNDLVEEKYPFDESPGISVKDNTGSMGVIFKADRVFPDVLYSLYLTMENPRNEENLSRHFNALKTGIRIKE